jgi:hypothetical protein
MICDGGHLKRRLTGLKVRTKLEGGGLVPRLQ